VYAAQQDLYDRFGQTEITALADRDGDGVPDPGVIDAALADASAEMDGYFRAAGYVVPATQTPTVTTRICANLARYNLYTNDAPEQVQRLHDDSIAWLKMVASGQISLGVASDGSEPAGREDIIEFTSTPNVFARGSNTDSDGDIY
jgi:phage gp36-like protein